MYIETAGGVTLKQWKAMTPVQKKHYLKIHPNSMYAKKLRIFNRAINSSSCKFDIKKVGDRFQYSFTVSGKPIFQGFDFSTALEAGQDFVSYFPEGSWLTEDSAYRFLGDIKKQFGE